MEATMEREQEMWQGKQDRISDNECTSFHGVGVYINTLQTGQPFKLNTPVPGHFQAFKPLKKGIFLLTFPCYS
jgi:hypothetical protein